MNHRGVVLIEVMIAIVILAMAGTSAIAFLSSTLDAQRRIADREAEVDRAERVLAATALLTRTELDRRVGRREVGEFVVWVDRPQPSLFRIGIAPATRPTAEILVTLVYRRNRRDADDL